MKPVNNQIKITTKKGNVLKSFVSLSYDLREKINIIFNMVVNNFTFKIQKNE